MQAEFPAMMRASHSQPLLTLTDIPRPGIRISRKTIAIVSLGIAALALFDGFVPQIEMIATGGNVPLSTAILKPLLFAMLILAMASQTNATRLSRFVGIWLLTILYLAADSIYLAYNLHYSFSDILIGYSAYYLYFLICPLVASVANELPERRVVVFLITAFLICFGIGTAQFLLAQPLLYTDSADGNFRAMSWNAVGGSVRAFSLFASGLDYGSACCLIGALGVSLMVLSRYKKLSLLLFLCAAYGCYSTITRNCYIQFLMATCATFCLTSNRLSRRVKYFPVPFLLVAILVAWSGTSADISRDSAITSNLSVIIRAVEWKYYISLYWASPLVAKLLGLGIVQNSKVTNHAVVAVDNLYLGILLHVGFIGLILMFWLQWKMWIKLYSRSIVQPSVLTLAAAGFWSAFLSVNLYSTSLVTFSLIFIIALLVRPGRNVGQAARINGAAALQLRSA
jgi:hypothetical protein